jgi:hypothetical protein
LTCHARKVGSGYCYAGTWAGKDRFKQASWLDDAAGMVFLFNAGVTGELIQRDADEAREWLREHGYCR